jgi:hypothetical protein
MLNKSVELKYKNKEKNMKTEKLSTLELLNAIEFLGTRISSGDNIHTYSQSPIHKLVYNEILKFSKDELNSAIETEKLRFSVNLFNISFQIKNPYIFAAFLKKGAFQDKLCKESKWVLKQKKQPSNELYSLVYNIQSEMPHKHYDDNQSPDHPAGKTILFDNLLKIYAAKLDTPEKIEVVDNYFKQFGKKMEEQFLNFIYAESDNKKDLCDYLVIKLKNNGCDFTKNKLMNNYLPEVESWHSQPSFFISSSHVPQIQRLLDYGFRFDEKEYSFEGDNLFIAAIKSKRVDIIKAILPTLTDITPKDGDWIKQTAYIDSLAKEVKNDTDRENYQFIKTLYQKLLIEHELGLQPATGKDKPKSKI